MVRKATNHLLVGVGEAMEKVVKNTADIFQLAQLSVNTKLLEDSCNKLERYISSITHSRDDDVHDARLHGASSFQVTRQGAEETIFYVLTQKIDECFALAYYEWAPVSDDVEPETDFLFDLLAYLMSTFGMLKNILPDVAKTGYLSTCKHLHKEMLNLLLSDKCKRVNMAGLKIFAKDIERCEDYANSCPITSQNERLCEGVFQPLRELINLFIKVRPFCVDAEIFSVVYLVTFVCLF